MKKIIIIPIIGLMLINCAHTKITSVVDPGLRGKSYSKLLIISTFSDLIYKEAIEKKFVQYCTDYYVRAVSGSKILPPTKEYSSEEISRIMEVNNVDGILIVALQDYWESQGYIPPSSTTKGSASVVGNSIVYSQRTQSFGGGYFSKPRVVFDSRLFDAESGIIAWRSTSLTRGNAFAKFKTLASSLSKSTINQLLKDRVIKTSKVNRRPYNRDTGEEYPPQEYSRGTIFIYPISENELINEINTVKFLYNQKRYEDAILRLSILKRRIEKSQGINNINFYLANIYFVWGACFINGWNRTDIAAEHFKKSKEYNPLLMVNPKEFSKDIIDLYKKTAPSLGQEDQTKNKFDEEEIEKKQPQPESEIYFKGTLVRVVKENAVLRLNADDSSSPIKNLPLGAVLTIKERTGEWLKVELPPNRDGIVIMGFIRINFIAID